MVQPVSVGPCWKCKEPIWLAEDTHAVLRRSAATFYCPNGHNCHFPHGPTEAEKLEKELAKERQQRQRAEQRVAEWADEARAARDQAKAERNRANGYKGHATRLSKRAKAGVCPCCNRTFQQLARHMATRHPTFTPLEIDQGAPAVPPESTLQ
jgi:Zn-finger protein